MFNLKFHVGDWVTSIDGLFSKGMIVSYQEGRYGIAVMQGKEIYVWHLEGRDLDHE